MEQEIIIVMKKRNKYLEKFYNLNEDVIDQLQVLNDEDLNEFYQKREALLKLIISCDNEISSLSMCNWERFKFEPEYKSEYVTLSTQKKKLITSIIDQDLLIMSRVNVNSVEKIA